VAFSPGGGRLASTSEDGTLKVWDVSAGLGQGEVREPVFTRRHKEGVIGVAFSPDGQLLASVSGDADKAGEVKVWDAASGGLLGGFPGPQIANRVVHLAFSPDSRLLASGTGKTAVTVWDVTTRQELYTLAGHEAPILNVTFTPDGRRLISAGQDRVVNVWELPPREPGAAPPGGQASVPRWPLHDFATSPWAMALSPDGSRLAIGGPKADGNIRVYDMTTEKLINTLMGHNRVVSLAFSPDGRRLASAGADRTVKLWDTATGQDVLSLPGHLDSGGRVLFSPDGQRLASASQDGMVRVWDASPLAENADPHTRTVGGPEDGEFNGVAFSPGGRRLASASSDKSIKLWDAQNGQEVRAFHGHEKAALCVAFSPDGRHVLSGGMDRTVKLWDAQTGEELPLHDCDRFELLVYSVAFSPDGHTFAAGAHLQVQLRDLTGRLLLPPLQADSEFVSCVAFSPDGKRIATGGHAGILKIWNVISGEEVGARVQKAQTNAVAFHPTGTYLASGDSKGNVNLWNPATGRAITLSGGADTYVSGVAFSVDGKYLAAASWKDVIVWDVSDLENIKQLRKFDRLAGRIWGVAFSPDGKRLAAASGYKGKGEIKIWDSALWED
jgi:WD40 repeat protein